MAIILRPLSKQQYSYIYAKNVKSILYTFSYAIQTTSSFSNVNPVEEEFRVFDVRSGRAKIERQIDKYVKPQPLPPREKLMSETQDWPSVWPGPKTFHPASVPLPVRQGVDKMRKKRPSPAKYCNVELMKLPNFLHLTPPAIDRHCKALKKFCTPWPKGLETDEALEEHFPIEVMYSDYCFSSPRIKDPKARVVSFKFKLAKLALDNHAKDKIKRLLGSHYDSETDIVTFVTDRCPTRKQNYDYNHYLLRALFYESWNVEKWEEEKAEVDMEYYDWEKNKSKEAYIKLKVWPEKHDTSVIDNVSLENDNKAKEYKEAVELIMNEGDSEENLAKYKQVVLKIVF